MPPFAEWTENVLQKSYSVNMCIIIHSSECIVCLLWPHFQRAQKQAGGVGSQNKSLSSPPAWASDMLTTQPAQSFTGLLAAHEWQLNYQELFQSARAEWLHCKKYFCCLNSKLLVVKKNVIKLTNTCCSMNKTFQMQLFFSLFKQHYVIIRGPGMLTSRWTK